MMTRPSTLLLLHAARALLGLRSSRPKTLRQVSTLESPKTATRRSGLSFLPPSTIKRAEVGNPIEKNKLKKGGDAAWTDVYDFAAQIRAGTLDYERAAHTRSRPAAARAAHAAGSPAGHDGTSGRNAAARKATAAAGCTTWEASSSHPPRDAFQTFGFPFNPFGGLPLGFGFASLR